MTLIELSTPCLLLDQDRLVANCQRMRARAARASLRLRPHLKTLKCLQAANLAVDASRAIAVSTLTEAAFFASHGIRDILVAVCLPVSKLDRAVEIAQRHAGCRLSMPVEDEHVARQLVERLESQPARLGVWVEIDCGEHRTGLAPDSEALIKAGTLLARSRSVDFRGVMTHAGQSYGCRSEDEIKAVATAERDAAVAAKHRLLAAGLPCADVSVGSTPTAVFGDDWTGVTELRPGVYMAGDLFQQRLGTVRTEDLALTVLSTVISSKPGRCVIDAGGLALSKDRSLLGMPGDPGFGEVLSVDGAPLGLRVHDVHQEHGEIHLPPGVELSVGQKVRVIPVHACMTAAAHAGYHVVQSGQVVGEWHRVNGWA